MRAMANRLRWYHLPLAIGMCFLILSNLRGQMSPRTTGMGGGFGAAPQPNVTKPVPRIHFREALTPAATTTAAVMAAPLESVFPNETPLENVLQAINEQTRSETLPNGIPIYVDPVGLLRAERTMQSPVLFNLKGFPIATSLELMLSQLELSYVIRPDGIVIISTNEQPWAEKNDPLPYILDEIRALRTEVESLRTQREARAPR